MLLRNRIKWYARLWYSRLFQQRLWLISCYKNDVLWHSFMVKAGNYADACEKARKQQPCLSTIGWAFICAESK